MRPERGLSHEQGLRPQQVQRSLSRRVRRSSTVFRHQSHSHVHLRARIYRRPVHELHLPTGSGHRAEREGSVFAYALRPEQPVPRRERSSRVHVPRVLRGCTTELQAGMRRQLGVSTKQSVSQVQVHGSVPGHLRSGSRLSRHQPQSALQLSARKDGRSVLQMLPSARYACNIVPIKGIRINGELRNGRHFIWLVFGNFGYSLLIETHFRRRDKSRMRVKARLCNLFDVPSFFYSCADATGGSLLPQSVRTLRGVQSCQRSSRLHLLEELHRNTAKLPRGMRS